MCQTTLTVTMPADNCGGAVPMPYPTIYMISGFECIPAMYSDIADRLASWGYAVIQVRGCPAGIVPLQLLHSPQPPPAPPPATTSLPLPPAAVRSPAGARRRRHPCQ